MTQFIIALLSALLPLGYYLSLLTEKQTLPGDLIIFGALPVFVMLHIALRRTIKKSHIHVFLLVTFAALFTFHKTFINNLPFLYALISLQGLVLIAVCLTYPLGSTVTEQPAEDNAADKEENKE